jgi:hypothetical protein
MRTRYLIVVATIATNGLTACSDAAVDQVTAPPSAATPVQPVANTWPSVEEYETNEISSAIGIQITPNPYFSADTLTFVVEAQVKFQWANDVGATIWASIINRNGTVINSSEAGMSYQRFGLPVASGDTTFVVRVSTNRIKCGLTGKAAYAGHAYTKAIDTKLLVFNLWEQEVGKTNAPDVVLPDCPEEPETCEPVSRVIGGAPAALPSTSGCDDEAPAPPSGTSEPVEVCYVIWREFWIIDLTTYQRTLLYAYPVGLYCFVPEE